MLVDNVVDLSIYYRYIYNIEGVLILQTLLAYYKILLLININDLFPTLFNTAIQFLR